MAKRPETGFYLWRFRFVVFCLSLCVLALFARMVDLTVYERDFLQNQGDARALRILNIPANRGMITDRTGQPLAISTPVASVWCNPKSVELNHHNVTLLAKRLGFSLTKFKKILTDNASREFVYLKRGVNPNVAKNVKSLGVPGVYLQREYRRYYPEGEVTAQVLGFTNIDDRGQEGLELQYDSWLRGIPGKKRVQKDRLGRVIADVAELQEPHPGKPIALSLDKRIQYLAYRELKSAVNKAHAKSGSLVVLDAKSGEVLAMVNQPSFNPNQRHKTRDGSYRNRAVTDVFEPGSVIKAFSIASALSGGKFTPKSVIDTNPGWMMLGGNTIKDMRNYKKLSLTEILQHSSNIGVTKATLAHKPEHLLDSLEKFGFGRVTHSGFPGESAGALSRTQHWSPFQLATLSWGYGLSVTTLQLAQAYTVFANQGKLLPVSLLHGTKDSTAPVKQVISPKVAEQVLQMLAKVVEKGGTGTRATVKGYRVAGKTGTARLAGKKGYDRGRHLASFVGIAPVKSPRLVVAVIINEPQKGPYYGGLLAAPVFSKDMGRSLRTLNV